MCGTCGCSDLKNVGITSLLPLVAEVEPKHAFVRSRANAMHQHEPKTFGEEFASAGQTSLKKTAPQNIPPVFKEIELEESANRLHLETSLLAKNDALAAANRQRFEALAMLALNLVSSPGAGKTTLLEATLTALSDVACAVIEGDQATLNDAERIRATGTPVVQINTGKGCHLEASMVKEAADNLELKRNSLLFIENVGNLVCPAMFDLGEAGKVLILSVTEGDDKPLKYPHMFRAAELILINKIDLAPYVDFNLEACKGWIKELNPAAKVICLSAKQPETLGEWLNWLKNRLAQRG